MLKQSQTLSTSCYSVTYSVASHLVTPGRAPSAAAIWDRALQPKVVLRQGSCFLSSHGRVLSRVMACDLEVPKGICDLPQSFMIRTFCDKGSDRMVLKHRGALPMLLPH